MDLLIPPDLKELLLTILVKPVYTVATYSLYLGRKVTFCGKMFCEIYYQSYNY